MQKHKDKDVQSRNFSCFVWMWDTISHIDGGT